MGGRIEKSLLKKKKKKKRENEDEMVRKRIGIDEGPRLLLGFFSFQPPFEVLVWFGFFFIIIFLFLFSPLCSVISS